MSAASESGAVRFDALDSPKINKFQLKIMFVSGMGFFTDAYDLIVIGIVVALLKTQWTLSTGRRLLRPAAQLETALSNTHRRRRRRLEALRRGGPPPPALSC
jgi:hypothetical protein